MSDLFKTHLITVYKNDIKNVPGSRNPTSGYTEIAKHIKCHIGRTGPSGSILKLHVLKQELEKFRKKKDVDDFKRRYFVMYDDVKISYKEDW